MAADPGEESPTQTLQRLNDALIAIWKKVEAAEAEHKDLEQQTNSAWCRLANLRTEKATIQEEMCKLFGVPLRR